MPDARGRAPAHDLLFPRIPHPASRILLLRGGPHTRLFIIAARWHRKDVRLALPARGKLAVAE